MAHPKRRQSKTRTAKRRTHDKAVAPTLAICPNCGEWHVYHTVKTRYTYSCKDGFRLTHCVISSRCRRTVVRGFRGICEGKNQVVREQ